ncbi:MAG: L-2-amino-thiazoline-4-carboxylic acid hydrolase [Clostridium sp.]|nr:L-2-amino-thiazoline-4-carboxylic acid hydrolase [Clostridium sp.]
MNTIQEIGLQNQQDFWAMLYMYMGKRIMDICGRRGEKAIRLGLRNMAVEKGRRLRADYLSKGVKTNLETLYAAGNNCSDDPRVRMEVLRQDEDIRIWEIYTCPMASLWLDQGQGWLGNLYCEENQHGLIQGFTGGKGQMNLTKKLTCHRTNGCRADNYCRFSSYYRAANTDEEQRRESFTASDEEYQPFVPLERPGSKEEIGRRCIETVVYMAKAAVEVCGPEGLQAVSLGLKDLAEPVARLMKHFAEATLSSDMEAFLAENLPVSLGKETDPLWGSLGGAEAARMFDVNFLTPFKRGMGLL